MTVFVIRGTGFRRYDSRRPFPVEGTPSRIDESRSCRNPLRTPFSTRRVFSPGVPSSSMPKEPRLPGRVASSAMETRGLAIR